MRGSRFPIRSWSTSTSRSGSDYGNLGWPARYLFGPDGRLFDYHYGEGGYDETERAIQELLEIDAPLLEPLRPEDAPGAQLTPQTGDVEGLYSGPYEAGGVWAVLDGEGSVTANGRTIAVTHAGAYELVSHAHSTAGELDLRARRGRDLPRRVLHARVGPALAAQREVQHRGAERGIGASSAFTAHCTNERPTDPSPEAISPAAMLTTTTVRKTRTITPKTSTRCRARTPGCGQTRKHAGALQHRTAHHRPDGQEDQPRDDQQDKADPDPDAEQNRHRHHGQKTGSTVCNNWPTE